MKFKTVRLRDSDWWQALVQQIEHVEDLKHEKGQQFDTVQKDKNSQKLSRSLKTVKEISKGYALAHEPVIWSKVVSDKYPNAE